MKLVKKTLLEFSKSVFRSILSEVIVYTGDPYVNVFFNFCVFLQELFYRFDIADRYVVISAVFCGNAQKTVVEQTV